jgi:hypothetical protein
MLARIRKFEESAEHFIDCVFNSYTKLDSTGYSVESYINSRLDLGLLELYLAYE